MFYRKGDLWAALHVQMYTHAAFTSGLHSKRVNPFTFAVELQKLKPTSVAFISLPFHRDTVIRYTVYISVQANGTIKMVSSGHGGQKTLSTHSKRDSSALQSSTPNIRCLDSM